MITIHKWDALAFDLRFPYVYRVLDGWRGNSRAMTEVCSMCWSPVKAHGLCRLHYNRDYRKRRKS